MMSSLSQQVLNVQRQLLVRVSVRWRKRSPRTFLKSLRPRGEPISHVMETDPDPSKLPATDPLSILRTMSEFEYRRRGFWESYKRKGEEYWKHYRAEAEEKRAARFRPVLRRGDRVISADPHMKKYNSPEFQRFLRRLERQFEEKLRKVAWYLSKHELVRQTSMMHRLETLKRISDHSKSWLDTEEKIALRIEDVVDDFLRLVEPREGEEKTSGIPKPGAAMGSIGGSSSTTQKTL